MIILGELIKIRGSDNYSDTGGAGRGRFVHLLPYDGDSRGTSGLR